MRTNRRARREARRLYRACVVGGLLDEVSDPVLLLLTIYLLEAIAPDAALESRVAAKRESLKAAHTPSSIQKAIEKSGANIQVVVLSKLLQDATQWLFAGGSGAAGAAAAAAAAATEGTDTVQ